MCFMPLDTERLRSSLWYLQVNTVTQASSYDIHPDCTMAQEAGGGVAPARRQTRCRGAEASKTFCNFTTKR